MELTRQERRVLALLAHGHTIETAAEVMGIRAQTAKNHASSAYRRLGVTNRYGAFLELGWLTPPDMEGKAQGR